MPGCGKKRRGEPTDTEATSTPSVSTPAPVSTPVPKPAAAPAKEKDPNAGLGGLARVWTEQDTKNRLKQIVLAYHNYIDSSNGKAPAKASDLAPFYDKEPNITEALDKGWIVFLYNVRLQQMTQGTSNTILAYEAEPDRSGRRWIVKADGSVDKVSQQEFDKMPKAGK